MAVLLNDETTINTNVSQPESINTSVSSTPRLNATLPDINYIPGYKEAEAERRANEVVRQENEANRIALYEDMEYKLETGYFNGEDGEDGFSPIANVSKTGDTATITITDKDGTTTASISDGTDGVDGQDGQDGQDGYSPTATVTKSGKVATITITDKDGTTTAEIRDGEDGQGSGDMLKSTYDTNDNGIVDNAEKVNNHTVGCDVPADAVFTDTTYTAGTGIEITNGVISNTQTSTKEIFYLSDAMTSYTYGTSYAITSTGNNAVLKQFMEAFAFGGNENNELWIKIRTIGQESAAVGSYVAAIKLNLIDFRAVTSDYYTRSNSVTRVVFSSENLYSANYLNKNGDNLYIMCVCSVNSTNKTYTISSISVTRLKNERLEAVDYLSKTNTASYTPTSNYHPATKKYVDDNKLSDVALLAVSDTAPAECSTGDIYYNTTTNLLYTATATDTWGTTGSAPLSGILYILFDSQTVYAYDGTELVSVGGGSDVSDLIVVGTDTPTEDTKLQIESNDLSPQGTYITNVYSQSTTTGYSANYVNGLAQNRIMEKGRIYASDMTSFSFGSDKTYKYKSITFDNTYTNVPIVISKMGTSRSKGYYGDIASVTTNATNTGCDLTLQINSSDNQLWVDYIVISMD